MILKASRIEIAFAFFPYLLSEIVSETESEDVIVEGKRKRVAKTFSDSWDTSGNAAQLFVIVSLAFCHIWRFSECIFFSPEM